MCTCGRPGCTLHPFQVHYPPRVPHWDDETASPEEQEELKRAHARGEKIEAKGRETIDCGYVWAVVESPKWDFCNNHYRLAEPEKK